jgi:hypothetical protein
MNIKDTYGVITAGHFCVSSCYTIKNVPYRISPSLNEFILRGCRFIFYLNLINYVTIKKNKKGCERQITISK